jgi:hypothetical protein
MDAGLKARFMRACLSPRATGSTSVGPAYTIYTGAFGVSLWMYSTGTGLDSGSPSEDLCISLLNLMLHRQDWKM